MEIITPQDLKKKIEAGEVLDLVDVRDSHTYEHSHIPSALNVGYADAFEEKAVHRLPDKDQLLVVYGAHEEDSHATEACKKLEELGYNSIVCLPAGLMGWMEAGYQVDGGRES